MVQEKPTTQEKEEVSVQHLEITFTALEDADFKCDMCEEAKPVWYAEALVSGYCNECFESIRTTQEDWWG